MELRPELMPPTFDEELIARLSKLAARLDGAGPGEWEDDLVEFNRLAGTDIPILHFQGIYGGEEHETWVRRVLCYQHIKPVTDVTKEELVEIIRRADPRNGYADYEDYMAIFDANVPLDGASNLLFYPPDYDGESSRGEYDPTPEQIVEWATQSK